MVEIPGLARSIFSNGMKEYFFNEFSRGHRNAIWLESNMITLRCKVQPSPVSIPKIRVAVQGERAGAGLVSQTLQSAANESGCEDTL